MMTLADKSLLSGGDNKPPMLKKHLYDSWKSRMELYMLNRPHSRVILASVEKGPLVWPTITVDGVTRPKDYTELTPAETIQADCDIKAINIILQGLPTKIFALISQHHSRLTIPVFKRGDDPINAINHLMSLLSLVVTSLFPTTNNQLRNSSNPRQQAIINYGRVTVQPIQGRQISYAAVMTKTFTPAANPGVPTSLAIKAPTIIPHNAAFQTEDLDTYDSDCDDLATAQAVLMTNISSYGSDVIYEVPNLEQYLNDMDNQSVHALQDFEQSPVLDLTDNEIHSDSNIIPYSQYLQETQQATVQDTNVQAQQDSITLSMFEQMSEQMIN
ncbi:hypothetical protein Tco_1390868, partial [Tanacetum coccineum]